jgi:L-glyceraldehyde 3-phosphate reductase
VDARENARAMILRAFDLGITHFDLANNYGPPPGSAESTFGEILRLDLKPYRDELVISTKAGYEMWPGPYGDWGSRKYLLASLDQSLKRLDLEYVDIFYSHRPDPDTPIEETMSALDQAVRSGRALYAGISNYNPEQTATAVKILRQLGTPCLIHQVKYSMFKRDPEDGLLDVLGRGGVGGIAFCPLAQGLLTDRYLQGIPSGSRASKPYSFLKKNDIDEHVLIKVRALNELAAGRGQSLAQMALAWVLRDPRMTSALIGASRVEQIEQNIAALANLKFSSEERARIDAILCQPEMVTRP